MSTMLKLKLRPTSMAPVTTDGLIPDMKNVAAVIFQNTGTTNARIFNGNYTVLANGGTLSLDVTEDFGSMDILQLDVMFQGAGTNRLEVLTIRYGADAQNVTC